VTNTQARNVFADPPATLPRLEDCSFYHSIDLPGLGLQVGSWDLRGRYDEYFGECDFSGERVLDLGMASGALAFELERRGAREVVGFDLDDGQNYDCRLPADEGALEEFRSWVQRVKNGFWLARGLLGSHVKVAYGHVRSLPEDLGWFDTVMMGNILQHLQDPVGAVLQAVQHTDHRDHRGRLASRDRRRPRVHGHVRSAAPVLLVPGETSVVAIASAPLGVC